MTELNSNNSVFAFETTPDNALQIHSLVAKFVPSVSLKALPNQKRLYEDKFGFEYEELDSSDPVSAALKNMSDERQAKRASANLGGNIRYSMDYPNLIYIALGAIGAGITGEIGKDLWSSVKIIWKRLWNWLQQNEKEPSQFERLITDLQMFLRTKKALNVVILLQIRKARLTFIIDPCLPKKAIKQAEHILNRPKQNFLDSPLRWDRDHNKWLPDMNAILTEEALRELRADIQKLVRSEFPQFFYKDVD